MPSIDRCLRHISIHFYSKYWDPRFIQLKKQRFRIIIYRTYGCRKTSPFVFAFCSARPFFDIRLIYPPNKNRTGSWDSMRFFGRDLLAFANECKQVTTESSRSLCLFSHWKFGIKFKWWSYFVWCDLCLPI